MFYQARAEPGGGIKIISNEWATYGLDGRGQGRFRKPFDAERSSPMLKCLMRRVVRREDEE